MSCEEILSCIREMQEIATACDKEDTLKSFCFYNIQMLKTALQIEKTDFFYYTNMILNPALKLYIYFFKDEMNEYLHSSTSNYRRMEIMADLEMAVVEMSNYYKNIIESSNSADKHFLQTIPLSTNMYELYIKLCAFYTQGISYLIKIMSLDSEIESPKENHKDYVIGIYPTICRSTESILLFQHREKMGKIILMHVPERQLFNTEILPTYLVHEVFRILSNNFRKRKFRANQFHHILMDFITMEIFRKPQIEDKPALTEKVKCEEEREAALQEKNRQEIIVDYWFSDFQKIMEAKFTGEEGERKYYSAKVSSDYAIQLTDTLKKIILAANQESLKHKLMVPANSLEEYQKSFCDISQYLAYITNNIYNIITEQKIQKYISFIFQMFHETYADLLMILVLNLTPERYLEAYQEMTGTNQNQLTLQNNLDAYWRINLIKNTMKTLLSLGKLNGDLKDSWENATDVMEKKGIYDFFENISSKNEFSTNERPNNEEVITCNNELSIKISKTSDKMFSCYLEECGSMFLDYKNKHSDVFNNFNTKFIQISLSSIEEMVDVLCGPLVFDSYTKSSVCEEIQAQST